MIKIKAVGTRFYDKEQTEWTAWWVLEPIDMDDEYIARELGAERFYCGPGCVFGSEPWIRRTKTRILVTQMGGYDI